MIRDVKILVTVRINALEFAVSADVDLIDVVDVE